MKVEALQQPPAFTPITVTVTIRDNDELQALLALTGVQHTVTRCVKSATSRHHDSDVLNETLTGIWNALIPFA